MDFSADASAALFERIRLGDSAAEADLVASFGGRIFAMALARTRDREASRDLVQDVLWTVVQALRRGNLRAPDKLAAFVSGTARNLINNYCRSRARTLSDTHSSTQPLDIRATDPDQTLDDQQRASALRGAVRNLDPVDRRILTLTLVDGLTPGEIASRLDLSSDVVRQRKSRAIKRVIALLAERQQP